MVEEKKGASPVLGFGASGAWGQPWFSEREAIRLVHQALDAGIRHFDTAGFYAHGEAERRLGKALRGRNDVFISTKTGTKNASFGRKKKDFSQKAIRADIEASLKRLNRDHVNCLYLHGPDYWVVEDSAVVFADLKSEGKIQQAGVCGEGEVLAQAVADKSTDTIMGVYNLFDQRHHDIFQQAKNHNIQVTSIAPLAQAFYRKGFFKPKTFADGWSIARALLRDREKINAVPASARAHLHNLDGVEATQVMLAFVFAQKRSDIILTTTTKPMHLAQSVAQWHAEPDDRVGQLIQTIQGILEDEAIRGKNDNLDYRE